MRRIRTTLGCAVILLLLTACAAGKDKKAEEAAKAEAFQRSRTLYADAALIEKESVPGEARVPEENGQGAEEEQDPDFDIPFLGFDPGPAGLIKDSYILDEAHGEVFAWYPDDLVPGETYPLVLALNCTNGNPEAEVRTNGWDVVAREDRLIVVSPNYNDSVTHPEAAYIKSVVDDAINRFPVDTQRIYSTGFSNGGAFSAVLAGTYPGLFAGIAGMGWLDALPDAASAPMTPFVLIQGSQENPTTTASGATAVIDDEKNGIRDLFACNGIYSTATTPDYDVTPYWGYVPESVEVLYPFYTESDPFGYGAHFVSGVKWTISCYTTPGYRYPTAKLILVDGAGHVPHTFSARIAWNTLKHFRRLPDWTIVEED